MTPRPPGALKHLLETLSPERSDPFPHLENLTPAQLLKRRVEVTRQLKTVTFRKDVAGWRLFRPPAGIVTPPRLLCHPAVH